MKRFPGKFFSSRGSGIHPSGRDEAGFRERGTHNLASAAVVVTALVSLFVASSSNAFTLLNFPSQNELDAGAIPRWQRGSVQFMPDVAAFPRVMSIKIDDQFLESLPAQEQADAFQAVWNALDTWSLATSSMISFQESAWPVSPNIGDGPLAEWEGPAFEDWDNSMLPIVPGWGANIEFRSLPGDATFVSRGQTFTFETGQGPDRLGFTVINKTGTSIIESTEIYLNEDYDWTTDGQGGFDIETVILHELGHALGLDHPNETIDGGCAGAINAPVAYQCSHNPPAAQSRGGNNGCNDSPNFDPILWTPGDPSSPADVMNGAYSGIKRQITDDEIGGMAFIYRPFPGDLTGQFNCTLLDVATAVQFTNGMVTLDPRAYAAADFMNHNGFIDAIELSYMLDWASNPNNYDQGGIPQFDQPKAPPSSMTITASADPYDVGKGGMLAVSLDLQNPNAIPILSWTVNIRYDETAFLNFDCIEGDFPASGFKIMSELEPGLIQLGKISATPSSLTVGDLGDLTFDIDIPAAVAMQTGSFVIEFIEVVVNDGMIREYGLGPDDNVFLSDAQVIASDLDVNGDSVVNHDDLYQWHITPNDVDQSGSVTDADRERLSDCLRSGEQEDMLTEQE